MPMIQRSTILSLLALGAALLLVIWPAFYTTEHLESRIIHIEENYVVGIDLGLHYARIAVYRNYEFEIISDEQNRSAIPSYVAFREDGDPLVGHEAKEQAMENPKNTIFGFRNLIGRKFDDQEVQDAVKEFPYDIRDQGGEPVIVIHPHSENIACLPEDISALVLTKLKNMAESQLNSTIRDAVITVPSYFNHSQREATKRAANIAGLNPLRILHEASAVGIAHRLDVMTYDDEYGRGERLYVVFDVREGESEVTLLSSERGSFEILGEMRNGDFGSGGFEVSNPSVIISQNTTMQPDTEQGRRALEMVEQVLANANIAKQKIDGILLSGDFPASAKLQQILQSYFPSKTTIPPGTFPDQAVAHGAAWQGHVVRDVDEFGSPVDVTLLGLGIELNTEAFVTVIPRQTVFPTRRSVVFSAARGEGEGRIIRVFEGQREVADKNRLLGELDITELLDLEEEAVEVEVRFELDGEERLMVEAKRKGGLFSQGLRSWLWISTRRDPERLIEANLRDGEKFREEDLKEVEGSKMLVSGVVDVVHVDNERSEL